ncbi:MAG TPA: hypothetical protein VFB62_13840 [Polyangiaceae bacterium]|jgi:hypothetical protein|nr:hypothetical protein [Polyangiaceae bacterium]
MRVWHDPLLTPASQQRAELTEDDHHENGNGHSDENGGSLSERSKRRRRRAEPVRRTGVRIIAGPNGARDPREIERERLLARLLVAEGRPLISAAVEAYLGAGFELPHVQDVWLQLLEHNDEERVSEAIAQLSGILEIEVPKRRKVLESRLRRIEELAEMSSTRERAANLRRMLHTRYAETLDPAYR